MIGPYVHRLDPVMGEIGGIYLWWYGLAYSLGFLAVLAWLRLTRRRNGLSRPEIYDLTLFLALGVLLGGRLVQVLFYEWPFYRNHLGQWPSFWLGGMASHGVLLGAAVGAWCFCRLGRKSFLAVADELVIPGAFLLCLGRIGNFIDGQIVGRVTSLPWGVLFPDAADFRHPVVLYDGAKNLLLIPLLLIVRQRRPRRGMVMAHFIFWYGFLRLFVDHYREYSTSLLGLATGQSFNLFMALLGAGLILAFSRRPCRQDSLVSRAGLSFPAPEDKPVLWVRRGLLAVVVLFALVIPSDWTQDVPSRYAKRHPGMEHSLLYPPMKG
jgi:phosphatidylglycerol:prolipoprotein diacylglycerol transferase